ncbi:hypothetical protein K1719_044968 [Acacia pycnantha]|nr:hypothetical protein K1719_044968 [Acacia pycnantha]
MKEPRVVARKFLARPQHEGVGVVVRRSIRRFELKCFDPFLLLDEFSVSTLASFPDYPHRGLQFGSSIFVCSLNKYDDDDGDSSFDSNSGYEDDDEECEGEDKEEEEEEEGENEVVPWS